MAVEPIASNSAAMFYPAFFGSYSPTASRNLEISGRSVREGQDLGVSDLSPSESDRKVTLAKKLTELVNLREDWDGYGAEAPTRVALKRAFGFMLDNWDAMPAEAVLPSVEGGVTVVYSSGSRGYAHFEFENRGEIVAAYKRPGERARVWAVRFSPADLQGAMRELRQLLNPSA